MYIALKHLHLTLVLISISLFFYRFVSSKLMAKSLPKPLKILPHVVDTFLLLSAVGLCIVLKQYPLVNDWLTLKVLFVIGYIIAALFAMKAQVKTKSVGFAIVAVLCVLFAAKVAVMKTAF
ncbi:MAG: SirB2 family protein [Gammaproteobacteria bacterium]|nr:SirB2 family protein [Gammaproteobacteria bacterium]